MQQQYANDHYRKVKGFRRYPGRYGRPVYYVQMSREEVAGRRILWIVIGSAIMLLGGVVLWFLSMT